MIRVAIITFGCKVNLFESEQLKQSVSHCQFVSPEQDADIYIINGCTVTAATDAQVRATARKFAKKGRVIVTGCYARGKDALLEETAGIEFIERIEDVAKFLGSELDYEVKFDRARPFIKIQDGCDQYCAYCIIPYVRGDRLRSVPPDTIRSLLEKLAEQGYQEVVLTGIHIGKYGKDLPGNPGLSEIVRLAHNYIKRVRISSLEPMEIDDTLIEAAANGLILPHWHIPVQSGSDRVLNGMNRPYSADEMEERILRLVSAYPEPPGLGADIIAGFPGETDEDFLQTAAFIERMPFTYGHVFPFSARKGTQAALMAEKEGIPQKVIKERAAALRHIFAVKKEQYIFSMIGKKTGMMLETEKGPGIFDGTTDNYLQLSYRGPGLEKQWLEVVITEKNNEIYAVPVKR